MFYVITHHYSGENRVYNYTIELQTTPLPWGGVRYWFTCPLVRDGKHCERKVGALYLSPSGRFFGCRHCYDLTYKSSQEKGKSQWLNNLLAAVMRRTDPDLTPEGIKYYLSDERGKPPNGYYERMAKVYPDEFLQPDPRADYLSANELCQQSGISHNELEGFESARLLVPDTKDGRYRPKLIGWARKLKCLLDGGWKIDEIKAWAKGRWSTPNPRLGLLSEMIGRIS